MSRSVLFGLVCLSAVACAPQDATRFDGRSAERAIENIEPGMLVISEVMIDPVACRDLEGEWFEVTNLTDSWLQLEGLTVSDADFYRSTMSRFELAPRASAIFMQGPADHACADGPTPAGYFEGDIALNNRGDSVNLYNHKTGILVDQTPRFPEEYVVAGSSIQLQPGSHDPRANDSLDAWFVGSECPFDPHEPSPGEANRECDLDAPAPETGWFDLTCQGYSCEIPADFDPSAHLAEAWDEAEEGASWIDGGGDTLYFSNMHVMTDAPVRAADWFTAGHEVDASYEFAIPGDWENGVWDYWVWLDVEYNEMTMDTDSSFGNEALLTREASLAMVGGISFPEAVRQLADTDPDFVIDWMRIQHTQGDAEGRLIIVEDGTDRQAIWNVTTGQRLQ